MEKTFDFGTDTSPEETDYTRVTHEEVTLLSWVEAGVDDLDRGTGSDLQRDFVYVPSGSMTCNVALPNGTYDVTLTIGDHAAAKKGVGVILEGTEMATVATAAGQHDTNSTPYRVVVEDGTLTLSLEPRETDAAGERIVDGGLDPGFGEEGVVIADLARGQGITATATTVQTNGKILVAGTDGDDFALLRYNADGTLDETFGTYGKVTTDFSDTDPTSDRPAAVACYQNKIYVVGKTNGDFAIARYTSEGSADTTFNGTGKTVVDFGSANDSAFAVTFQTADHKIIVAGVSGLDFAVARLLAGGTLDNSFGDYGKKTVDMDTTVYESSTATAVTMQGDNVLVAGTHGNDFAVARLLGSNGSLDTNFGESSSGKRIVPMAEGDKNRVGAVALYNSQIYVAGTAAEDFAVLRLGTTGSVDTNFGTDGVATADFRRARGSTEGNGFRGERQDSLGGSRRGEPGVGPVRFDRFARHDLRQRRRASHHAVRPPAPSRARWRSPIRASSTSSAVTWARRRWPDMTRAGRSTTPASVTRAM